MSSVPRYIFQPEHRGAVGSIADLWVKYEAEVKEVFSNDNATKAVVEDTLDDAEHGSVDDHIFLEKKEPSDWESALPRISKKKEERCCSSFWSFLFNFIFF